MFYVYTYRDTRPRKYNVVFYVGKGCKDRAYHHWATKDRCSNKMLRGVLRKIDAMNLEPRIEIVSYFETAQEALAEEIRLITLYGRRDLGTGPLCNMTAGGDGALFLSEETERRRLEAAARGVRTSEARDKLSAASKKNWADADYAKNISEKMSEFSCSEAGRVLRSIASKARWCKEGAREAFVEVVKERWASDASRQAHSEVMKAKWNDEAYRGTVLEKRAQTHRTDEYRAAQSARAKASWAAHKLKQEAL